MTPARREVLQLGAAGLAGLNSPAAGALAQKGEPSRLRSQNRPVPFSAVSCALLSCGCVTRLARSSLWMVLQTNSGNL